MVANHKTYEDGVQIGLAAAAMLVRSGATAEDLAAAIGADPSMVDPREYQDGLGELRKIMGTDNITEDGR